MASGGASCGGVSELATRLRGWPCTHNSWFRTSGGSGVAERCKTGATERAPEPPQQLRTYIAQVVSGVLPCHEGVHHRSYRRSWGMCSFRAALHAPCCFKCLTAPMGPPAPPGATRRARRGVTRPPSVARHGGSPGQKVAPCSTGRREGEGASAPPTAAELACTSRARQDAATWGSGPQYPPRAGREAASRSNFKGIDSNPRAFCRGRLHPATLQCGRQHERPLHTGASLFCRDAVLPQACRATLQRVRKRQHRLRSSGGLLGAKQPAGAARAASSTSAAQELCISLHVGQRVCRRCAHAESRLSRGLARLTLLQMRLARGRHRHHRAHVATRRA